MRERLHNVGTQHPEKWRRDLNPEPLAGQNIGDQGEHLEKTGPTAYDIPR